jgi:hypothetical protein
MQCTLLQSAANGSIALNASHRMLCEVRPVPDNALLIDIERWVEAMGADDGEDRAFVDRLSAVFARELFQPMFQRAPQRPADVRALIADFRAKLDALDHVIATAGPGLPPPVNGAPSRESPNVAFDLGSDDSSELDDIGRNQRSRIRELILLDAMARETRPYSLQQLLNALTQKGFQDTSGAVVSQLHRLKKLGLINQPASGMYEITLDGLGHQRKLRASFGALVT